jgi:imidazolonepropionase-like amidohydrolase
MTPRWLLLRKQYTMRTITTFRPAARRRPLLQAIVALSAPFSDISADPLATIAPQDTLAIEHATVLPMDRDTALTDHTVLVARDRIVWMGPARDARVPTAARRIDGRGRYLIPGLADMHVHLDGGVEELPLYVAAGVTTLRNMRGRPEHLTWRSRTAAGTLVGPTIYTSGPTVAGPRLFDFGRGFVGVRTAQDAERVARQQARAGYDMIKVHSRLTVPAYQRLLAVARAAGIPVVGHVIAEVGLTRTLAAGQVSLEHLDLDLVDGVASRLNEGARAIAAAGAWVGTIVSGRDGRCTPPTETQRRVVAALRRANVKLLAGTDAGLESITPGTALHCELATLVQAGVTPYEALVSATRNAGDFARLYLKERVPFGTIAVGSRADLVLLSADPRRDIAAVARPVGTVLRGVWRPR